MAPKTITVKCPQCQRVYIDWHTPAIDERSKKEATTACSKCGHRSLLNELEEEKGVWQSVNQATPTHTTASQSLNNPA